MSQAYAMPLLLTDFAHQALTVAIPNSFEAVRSNFSGSSEPSNPVPFQWWADSSSGLLKIRNAAGNAWVVFGPLGNAFTMQLAALWSVVASMSATTGPTKVASAPRAGTIKRLVVMCETASTSSSGNEWQFTLNKRTNAAPGSTVALFSGTVGTFTALGGVGGGAEFVAHKGYVLTPNQNNTVTDLDELELTMTKVGSATTLANVRAVIEME